MSLGKRLISTEIPSAVCTTDSTDPFGDSSGVALYNLDYDASDASGSYDGTPSNVTFGVGGQINYGARFNGSSSKIELPNSSLGITDASNFSISYWFNTNSTTQDNQSVIWANGSNAGARFGSGINSTSQGGDTSVYFGMPIDGSFTYINSGTSAFTANTWVHVVCVKSSTTGMTLYVDKVSKATNTGATGSGSATSTGKNSIGMYHTSSDSLFFNGSIDQVRIFSKALNQSEVDALYAETACVYTSTTDIVNYPTGTTPVAYYKLDNSSEDYSTGGNDGTDTNIEYRFGRYGQAAVFNGSSSYIQADGIFSSSPSVMSVSVWFKTTVDGSILDIGDNSAAGAQNRIFFSSGLLYVSLNGGDGGFASTSATGLQDGNWHHIVAVWDDGTVTNGIKMYIDGATTPTAQGNSTQSFTSALDLFIGANDNRGASGTPVIRQYFNGSIDQVRIYSTALSSSQVTELYNEKPETDTSNFKAVLYEGTGATQYISNVGFDLDADNGGDGGLVWIKNRDVADAHVLFDSVRGAEKYIMSNLTSTETTQSNTLTSFEENGFFLGSDPTGGAMNANNESYVTWVWKGGGDDVLNEEGTIDSQVSANTEAGFSIVNWTGSTSTSAETVGHGLSSAPELVILKNRDASDNWYVFANGVTSTSQALKLNTDDAVANTSAMWGAGMTSTVAGIRPGSFASSSSHNVIMYCFHSVTGYSKIGTYTGSGSATEKPISTGFEPSFVMIKKTSDTGAWFMHDNKRLGTHGYSDKYIQANSAAEEVDSSDNDLLEFTSTGFSLRTTFGDYNQLDGTYIYMAFK